MKNKLIPILIVLAALFGVKAYAITCTLSPICPLQSTTLTTSLTGGIWSSSNTSIATIGSLSGIATGVGPGSTTITYDNGTTFETFTLNVSNGPTKIPTTNDAPGLYGITCVGVGINLNYAPTGGTWNNNTAVATITDPSTGNATYTGVSNGSDIVTYTLNGCSVLRTLTVGLPLISGAEDVCVGTRKILTCLTGIAWTSSDPAVADFLDYPTLSGAYTGISTGTATLTFTYISGCHQTVDVTIGSPAPITGNLSVCVGGTTDLDNATSGGTWSSSNTARATVGSTSGVVTGVSAGTATITYTATGGCYATATVTVGTPGSITGASTGCTGATTLLECATPGGTWTSSNSKATIGSSSGIVTGVAYGPVTLTYTVVAGCYSTKYMYIYPSPALNTTVHNNVCVTWELALTTTCSGSDNSSYGPCYDLDWVSSNESVATVSVGTVTPVAPGTTTITVTNGWGCVATKAYTVNPNPEITTVSSTMCHSSTQDLVGSPSGGYWVSSATSIATIGFTTGHMASHATNNGTTTIKYYTWSNNCLGKAEVTNGPCGKGGNTNDNVAGMNEGNTGYKFTPNPSDGNFSITQHTAADETATIKLMNYLGAVVYSGTLDFKGGSSNLSLPRSSISPGMYLISIANGKQKETIYKIIIQE